jgi:hypothetical protein
MCPVQGTADIRLSAWNVNNSSVTCLQLDASLPLKYFLNPNKREIYVLINMVQINLAFCQGAVFVSRLFYIGLPIVEFRR